ncbi:hypothetical protein THASP1DRAFT_20824, partial [Thamnocephalis sphaerospora]
LTNEEIRRYGRQLILPSVGMQGQRRLKRARVLVVGAGGLGSPALLYLAAAGVGILGVVDHDTVDASNLHRQVIHDETRVGMSKAQSAAASVTRLNRHCVCRVYDTAVSSVNAMEIVSEYDVVLDATDNVATRYLLNDACVLSGKPLVSGSALRTDGQLTIYNYAGGPCYRCLYPQPPPAETVTSCADGGVLGVVPGTIGCLQALYAIRILLTSVDEHSRAADTNAHPPQMLLFSAMHATPFRSIRLRSRRLDCAVCGDSPSVTALIDYVQFCGAPATDGASSISLLTKHEQVTCTAYADVRTRNVQHILLDVREPTQYDICSLPGSINIPLRHLAGRLDEVVALADGQPVYVICRLGNDSQRAVQLLRQHAYPHVCDVRGGLLAWTHEVDACFPIY